MYVCYLYMNLTNTQQSIMLQHINTSLIIHMTTTVLMYTLMLYVIMSIYGCVYVCVKHNMIILIYVQMCLLYE